MNLKDAVFADLSSPRLICLKGGLMLLTGLLSGGLLLATHADLQTTALLLITVWAFCRAYYFAFYVIQHYVDPDYRFAGLVSCAQYLWHRSKRKTDGNGCG